MYQTITSTNDGQAFIAVKRNRVKQENNKVYLQNKQEFEIELFNPTQNTKLAKISINGKEISSSGIVLKPGQRVYLERFLDETKKFLFETYEVEGSLEEVQKAIVKNGLVEIKFYDETTISQTISYLPPDWLHFNSPNTFVTTSCVADSFQSNYNSQLKQQSFSSDRLKSILRSETGRVEKGNESNQKFTQYNGNFNSWASNTVVINLLPVSTKPLESKDFAVYCTECGTKNKGNKYKFCPKCGNKFGE